MMCRQENRRSPSPALEPQSTNFQRERTKEALVLRQQVAELNAHLLQLRCTRRESDTLYAGSGTVNSSRQWRGIVSVWEDLAVVQNQERQRAEITNKELKMILARQRKVCRSFRKLIREKNLFDGMGLLCRLQPLPEQHKPRSDRFVPTFDISDPVLAELEAAVATLYLQSDLVIPPLEGQPAASCLTQDKRDEPLGTYTETSTVTPMTCPVLQAGEILWKCTTKKSRDPEKVPRFARARCLNSMARSCKLQLRNTVPIDGVNFVRKYEDADRVVLTSTATWFMSAGGLQYQYQVWTIISRSPIDPLNASVVQSFCRFGPKCGFYSLARLRAQLSGQEASPATRTPAEISVGAIRVGGRRCRGSLAAHSFELLSKSDGSFCKQTAGCRIRCTACWTPMWKASTSDNPMGIMGRDEGTMGLLEAQLKPPDLANFN